MNDVSLYSYHLESSPPVLPSVTAGSVKSTDGHAGSGSVMVRVGASCTVMSTLSVFLHSFASVTVTV